MSRQGQQRHAGGTRQRAQLSAEDGLVPAVPAALVQSSIEDESNSFVDPRMIAASLDAEGQDRHRGRLDPGMCSLDPWPAAERRVVSKDLFVILAHGLSTVIARQQPGLSVRPRQFVAGELVPQKDRVRSRPTRCQ